ncbi:MAG: C-terminal binding protein [Kiritimatiellae bacterium]|nr:C-terminal binding protein [Kiritimatiellia bacterium]
MNDKKKVIVTDNLFENLSIEKAILEPLGLEVVDCQCRTPETLIPAAANADFVLTQFAPVNAQVIAAMTRCRVIVRYGIGVDNVDLKAAAAKNIPVCNVPDYCIDEVADHTLALILATTRQVFPTAVAVKSGRWKTPVPFTAMHALKNMTVGLIGLGKIGREVAYRLKAFKCPLIAFDPAISPDKISAAGCRPVELERLYTESDIISLHCPSTEKTHYMINAKSLSAMRRGVIIVNSSRGTLIKTPDLAEALRVGKVSAAALDVTDPEPINTDSPLLGMDNVIITSHVASVSPNAVKNLREQVAEIVVLAAKGKKLPNIVNGVS